MPVWLAFYFLSILFLDSVNAVQQSASIFSVALKVDTNEYFKTTDLNLSLIRFKGDMCVFYLNQ